METKFLVDTNAGKLARWLRLLGYDALLFRDKDDGEMLSIALSQRRVILTKDTQFLRRRFVAEGKVKVILITEDDPEEQLNQVVAALNLDYQFNPFSLCLECNQQLIPRTKEEVQGRVPPHVFQTQWQYVECPTCRRVYWRGTHWQAMRQQLERWQNGDMPDRPRPGLLKGGTEPVQDLTPVEKSASPDGL